MRISVSTNLLRPTVAVVAAALLTGCALGEQSTEVSAGSLAEDASLEGADLNVGSK